MTPAISPRHSRLKTWCDHEFLPFWKMTFTLAIKIFLLFLYKCYTFLYKCGRNIGTHISEKWGKKWLTLSNQLPGSDVSAFPCSLVPSSFSCPHSHHSAPSCGHVLTPKQLQWLKLVICRYCRYLQLSTLYGMWGLRVHRCIMSTEDQMIKNESQSPMFLLLSLHLW